MNAFERLLSLTDDEKRARGVEHTPKEIAQQPEVWRRVPEILSRTRGEIARFLGEAGLRGNNEATLVLTGAGSSEFIGNAIASALRKKLKREVLSIPTTHLVTHASSLLIPGHRYCVLSFARSGNSPESPATFERVKRAAPEAMQIVVTCNRKGELARIASSDPRSLCITLPDETNDRSLVMTSSFSTMALTGIGLCYLDRLDDFASTVERAASGARRIIAEYGDPIFRFASRPFSRACFLGTNALNGTMQECSLKMQEMTEGRVASQFNSYLGLRHGPQVFVNKDCVVTAALSSDPLVRRYEIDMLRELERKKQGCGALVICATADGEIEELNAEIVELFPDGAGIDDDLRVMTDVVAGQMLATFKSLDFGLKPDNPSTDGTINRVVTGVRIYEP